jgi:hypothetical protein
MNKNGLVIFSDLIAQSQALKAEDLDNNFRRISVVSSNPIDISTDVTDAGTTLKLFYPVQTGLLKEKPGDSSTLYYTVTAYFSDGSGPHTEYSHEPIPFSRGFGYWS